MNITSLPLSGGVRRSLSGEFTLNRCSLGIILVLVTLVLANQPAAGIDLFKKKVVIADEPLKDDLTTIVRAQIYLDEKLFTPGKIDGRMGEFTRRAVAHYNAHHEIEPVSNWHYVLERSVKRVPNVFTTYKIRDEDSKFINPSLSYKYPAQAETEYLAYRRFAEFIAERFHCDEKLLEKINPGVTLSRLKVGDVVKVPNVTQFKIEDIPKHEKFAEDESLSARHVIVDTNQKVAAIWDTETGKLVASFPITPGKEQFIHRGDWELKNMVTTPEFRYDKSMLEEGVRSEEYYQLPPGPNSPVGIIWCGTSKSGIGLHGTASPHSIGRSQSAGCIRLSNWDAIRLPTLLRPGAKVTIR